MWTPGRVELIAVKVHADRAAATVVPYVATAVGAYGAAVTERARDTFLDRTTDVTVYAGQWLLRRILQRGESATQVTKAVQDLARDPADRARLAALRAQLRTALEADPQLVMDVIRILDTLVGDLDERGRYDEADAVGERIAQILGLPRFSTRGRLGDVSLRGLLHLLIVRRSRRPGDDSQPQR